jgi:hypothetical protein
MHHDAFSYSAIELGREVADALVVPPLRPYASRSAAARAAESETEKLLHVSVCDSLLLLFAISAALAACIYLPSQMHTPEMRPPHLPTGTTNQTPLHKRLFAAPKLENRPFARSMHRQVDNKARTLRSTHRFSIRIGDNMSIFF